MNTYLLGVDIGTSACKVALFLDTGKAVAQASGTYPVRYPYAGWAEQNPEDWWRAICEAIQAVLSKSGIDPAKIAGVGVDGQSWSAIAVDSDGSVLAPTPIWTDTRAQEECQAIEREVPASELFQLCGNPLQPSYTLPKILWYKRHLPEVYQRAAYILQSNAFLVYRLTGAITQDVSQGYGLCCFDMRKGQWNLDIARRIGIRPDLLPEIRKCHEVVGRVTREAARLTGLSAGTPVVAGGLDAACGTLGAGVIRAGQTQEQGGQAGGMSLCLDKYSSDPRLILGFHVVPGRWLLQGGTTGGGGALKWLRETACPELSFEEMSEQAETIPPGSDGLLFLPYMAGERSPVWNPQAKGVFFGLSYAHQRAHMIRAVMEGVAYSLRHNLEIAEEAGAGVGSLRAVGGSANSLVWTQMKADVTGRRIEVPASDTATTFGAAILAGVGTCLYRDFEDAVERRIDMTRVHEPDGERKTAYDQGYQMYRELYRRLEPMMRGSAGE